MPLNNDTVVLGTDGQAPIHDPNAPWKMWSIEEIYRGQAGSRKYIPKIKDYVIDPDTFETWIVKALDPITQIPTLHPIRPANMTYSFSETDVLFGVGPGTAADTYRAYVNKRTMPYTLSVDVRLKVAGTMTSYCKIYRGPVTGPDAVVVSKVYDSQGRFVSENVPLELIQTDSHTNHSVKIVPTCNTTDDLKDNEVITAVFYSDDGFEVSKRQLLVENTTFMRSLETAKKYISHISLESPFLSAADPTVINYPLNVPLNALNLVGVVYYTDGSISRMPVDGTKFKMFGLDQYTASIIGQQLGLVLSYSLSPGEGSISGTTANGSVITQAYRLVTMNPNNSYTVKLYGYPFWQDNARGYKMRWWLYNLDRNVYFEVTDKVEFSETTGAFDPKLYGYQQRKTVRLNLRTVSAAFRAYVHVQTVDITLNSSPLSDNTAWTVRHDSSAASKLYGVEVYAKREIHPLTIQPCLVLGAGFTTYEGWLNAVYRNIDPLYDPTSEVAPVEPTHFVLGYNGQEIEYRSDLWNKFLTLPQIPEAYETVTVRFIKRTSSGDMELGIAALIVRP